MCSDWADLVHTEMMSRKPGYSGPLQQLSKYLDKREEATTLINRWSTVRCFKIFQSPSSPMRKRKSQWSVNFWFTHSLSRVFRLALLGWRCYLPSTRFFFLTDYFATYIIQKWQDGVLVKREWAYTDTLWSFYGIDPLRPGINFCVTSLPWDNLRFRVNCVCFELAASEKKVQHVHI